MRPALSHGTPNCVYNRFAFGDAVQCRSPGFTDRNHMMNETHRAGRARVDSTPQILLLNPASTPSPHKTFEPNIYPNLGLLTLGTSLQCALRRTNVTAKVLYYDGALLGDEFIRAYIAENAEHLV